MYNKTRHCLICDTSWELHDGRENKHIYCLDCRRTERKIDYGMSEPCVPWTGEFDLDDNPVRHGKAYLPGERHCNHKDCVQKSHIQKPIVVEDLLAEQFSLYYRTGQRTSYDNLLQGLQREKMSV